MQKLFRYILSTGRERRSRVVGLMLLLLQMVRDIEESEMYRYSGELDKLDSLFERAPRRVYVAIEDECLNCEHALGFLECAIDDLKFAY